MKKPTSSSRFLKNRNNSHLDVNITQESEYSSEQGQIQLQRKTDDKTNFEKDLKLFRQEDLQMILKISYQTMQISQEMKNSLSRTDGSINTIESNVLVAQDNLKKADSETQKLYKNNDSSICKLTGFLTVTAFIIIGLWLFIYYKILKK